MYRIRNIANMDQTMVRSVLSLFCNEIALLFIILIDLILQPVIQIPVEDKKLYGLLQWGTKEALELLCVLLQMR